MFGFASMSDVLMPAPIHYSIVWSKQAELRKSGRSLTAARREKSDHDALWQRRKPERVEAVVLSLSTAPIFRKQTARGGRKEIINTCRRNGSCRYAFHINPTGKFVIGGPVGDCGLTGRKIIVDTYGGMARHGGGAFSGKDPSKVDRSAAYAGRYVAKNIVAAGLADRCEIQVSYAIGVAEPTSISVNTFGTAALTDDAIVALIREHFDLRPKGLIMLDLKRLIYRTAAYGTGRSGDSFPGSAPTKLTPTRSAGL